MFAVPFHDAEGDTEYIGQQVLGHDFLRGAAGDESTADEYREMVAVAIGEFEVVQGHDDRTRKVLQQLHEFDFEPHVEVVGRFVENDRVRFLRARTGDLYALAFAAGQGTEFARGER